MKNFAMLLLVLTLAFVVQVLSTENQPEGEDITSMEDGDKFEGDIVLTTHDKVDQRETGDVDGEMSVSQSKRNAIRFRQLLWKNKIIPYELEQRIPDSYKPNILAAFAEFHKHTCLKFVEHTNEKNWIRFVYRSGCWSSVGMRFWKSGYQEISLGYGCNHKGVIMHELLHALGFWHEQSRPDRNQYVEVFWENIKSGMSHNFNKYSHGRIDTLKAPYDLKSIMHYGSYGFSTNGKPTLLGIGANKGVQLGQRSGFTKTDIFEINALYDCSSASSDGWSSWSGYSPCNRDCKKIRQRFCSATDRSKCPGVNSDGVQGEFAPCPPKECNAPVDGHWGRWSSWTKCSVTCGIGSHTRTRFCDDPKPKNGGKDCVGNSTELGICEKRRCSSGPDDCEFETNNCMWSQVDTNNEYKWIRISGRTPSRYTGPDSDVSLGLQKRGHYIYAEASLSSVRGQRFIAKLQSTKFPAVPKGRCMLFAYNMYGASIGALNVYVVDNINGAKTNIFYKSGNQGQKWFRTNATIFSYHDYKIVFEATRGSGYTGDIALDDVFFKDGVCIQGQNPPPKPTTGISTPTRLTTVSALDCDFEVNMCKWSAVAGTNRFRWQRHTKGTPSWGTGPFGDHTTGKGYYVYMETSWQSGKGQTSYLVSPQVSSSNAHCLSFYYHMYGNDMGTLNVYTEGNEKKVTLFTKSGQQGNVWHRQQVTIPAVTYPYKVVFEGVRGFGYLSDFALDDIAFSNGAC